MFIMIKMHMMAKTHHHPKPSTSILLMPYRGIKLLSLNDIDPSTHLMTIFGFASGGGYGNT